MRVSLLVFVVFWAAGCVRAGATVVPDGRVADSALTETAEFDSAVGEAAPADAMQPDRPLRDSGPLCASTVDPSTLLLYTFSGSGTTVTDATGKHHGGIVGSGVARGTGPQGCGTAVVFPKATTDYILVADSPEWDLQQGSVDLWLRVDTLSPTSVRGIVSRDALQMDKPGHLSIFQLCDGGIAVRLQQAVNVSAARCSPPLSPGGWHHVGVNFGQGGLQLFVDGVEAKRTDTTPQCTPSFQCGTSTDKGLAGNDNPWVLGVSSARSAEGTAVPTGLPFAGAIDSFRISSTRRAFGTTP